MTKERKKHDFLYFVGICDSAESNVFIDVPRFKLLNQMASKKGGRFPAGYEPLQGCGLTTKLCLRSMTIQRPRLRLTPGWPNTAPVPWIQLERRPACVLNPNPSTEAFAILQAEAGIFEVRQRIRRHAADSRMKFDLVLDLMAFSKGAPICSDLADRFEAYLYLRSLPFLQDLLALLDMPDSQTKPSEPELPRAA